MDNTLLKRLTEESCQNDAPLMPDQEAKELTQTFHDWNYLNHSISKDFVFKNFSQVMGFINATAWIAQRQNHHPDVTFGYNTVKISFSTHSSGGLTRNDFICAAKVEQLLRL